MFLETEVVTVRPEAFISMVCCDVVDDMIFLFFQEKNPEEPGCEMGIRSVSSTRLYEDDESYSIDRIEIASMQTVYHLTAAVSMLLLLQRFEVIV